MAGLGAFVFVGVAVYLQMRKDGAKTSACAPEEEPIVVKVYGETVTFTELMHSISLDVIKVHAHTHALGVAAEYEWIRRRYPKAERLSQSLTTLDPSKGKKEYDGKQVHFDVLTVKLKGGMKKEIYFDISSFFSSPVLSLVYPSEFIAQNIRDLYEKA